MSETTVVGKIEQLTGAAPAAVIPTLTGSTAFIKANAELANLVAEKDARIAELEKALGNCRLLAMKRLHKGAIEKADWEAILRFCTEAGCEPSPLRADS